MTLITFLHTNLDETIVEMESEQRSSHASLLCDSFCDNRPDDVFSLWAGVVVELRVEVGCIG